MKRMKSGFICICLLAAQSLIASENMRPEKIYLNPDQIWIDGDGMYVKLFEDAFSVNALFSDRNGIYVMANDISKSEYTAYECPNGHPSRHGDGRCNQPLCPHAR